MAASKPPKAGEKKTTEKRKDRAAEIANTFEWLITAFILAFVFRAFVMEAFRIPTGSMADTLRGAHFRFRCSECGFKYDYGFAPDDYDQAQDTIPPGPVAVRRSTRCPSCGYLMPTGDIVPVANGDRILVLKCIYQLLEPKRWDVIVFKNPTNPNENYIKRLIGLPGDNVEIIDGDIYIDGQIARKPPQVQREVWMPVYNHDYQPVNPNQRGAFNGSRWRPPFDFNASAWEISDNNPTQLVLDRPADETHVLTYGEGVASENDFRVTYAYNGIGSRVLVPTCSDLMVRFYVEPAGHDGQIGITLSKYGVDYKAWLDFSGEMVLTQTKNGQETELNRKAIEAPAPGQFTLVKFANVDHQLLFEFNGNRLSKDLGRLPPRPSDPNLGIPPRAAIFGSGTLTLSHVALARDLHYTSEGQSPSERAVKGESFQLHEDEFFVLGDNSPNSQDGRWWSQPTAHSKGAEPPRAGIVPRYYLVGKALFVYWPSGFEFPWPQDVKTSLLRSRNKNPVMRLFHVFASLRWIPNVGQMRFIHGGTSTNE